ncbi:hypothetical protein [Urbifossiella limnaea]|uniref:hypothetical protein n=1 Tax=Urbifossiella limnaea TaxID=2528023 RepID=UPI0011A3ED77|nr:hypothetical protein [Urbifossiella limnaea]
MSRLFRTLRRLTRPALAVVLVLAQAVGAFGFPVLRSEAGAVKACGCVVACGTTPDCCCTTPPPQPEPEPEPPACPKCKAREAPKPVADTLTWVAAWKARQCRGESPAGVLAELPAVPPSEPVAPLAFPVPSAFAPPADAGEAHFVTDPSDPPPRG